MAVLRLAILRIDRRPVERQKVCLDRGYYRWTVVVEGNSGDVAFCASAYTLDFRAPPVTLHEQTLPPAGRA